MTASTKIEIRRGAYFDSVVLMHLQRSLAGLPGVTDAGVVMATPANCWLLQEGGLYPPQAKDANPDDLLIVVKAESQAAAEAALAAVDGLVAARRSQVSSDSFRPRSLDTALKALPGARWLLVSVPGRYAGDLARQGLERGLNVFLYSDNVPLEEEIRLKRLAREKGLLLMGPDCGTAIVNGVGLGFANRVRRGRIGLVGASGTGLQAITAAIHALGGGVSHAVGTGGRDLKREVGGITALQGLAALAADAETDVIILVSKPPAPEIAARLLAAAQHCGKPVVVDFIGRPSAIDRLGNVHFAANLQAAARLAVDLSAAEGPAAPAERKGSGRFLRGLFSGGTLAVEAVLCMQDAVYPLYTNVPVSEDQRLANPRQSRGHTIVDLGEDEFTQGRLHPMLDNDLRLRRLEQEAADPSTGAIWLDVVLGEGAHPDPAAELAPAIARIRAATDIEAAVLIVGTADDPQDIAKQAAAFESAGAAVFFNLQEAARHLLGVLGTPAGPPAPAIDLNAPMEAINAGLESFHESLAGQGARAVHMDWRPPAGGNENMAAILARLKG